ncbi:MAG: hypothetical protein L0H94_03740 [Nitrospira sp.]|nr:hypothetical protein [Nitrospira sp.]
MEKYPIVYIRGYAMTQGEVESTFNSPFYGFELGSTQYKLGSDARPNMHIFESPLVRLIEEEGYVNTFNRYVSSTNEPLPSSVPAGKWRETLWIFRFYDPESHLLGANKRPEVEDYAEKLAVFLHKIRLACGAPKEFKVNLVAHSMGGLVARCYLQNRSLFNRSSLKSYPPTQVNALFTYGTPHKGIVFRHGLGWAEDIRDLIGFQGSDTFGTETMQRFLSLKKNQELHEFRAARKDMSEDRIFCLVGTNYKDYVIWVSKHAVGPASDGLVAIESAYIQNSARAYVHRAHSGPFGLVNSEEGYQNLVRFLFGDIRFEVSLESITVERDLPNLNRGEAIEFLEINVDVAIRGLPTYLNTRRDVDNSSIIVRMRRGAGGKYVQEESGKETHLFTGFLRKPKTLAHRVDNYLRAAIQVKVVPHYTHKNIVRASRFEGEAILNDRLHLGIPVDLNLNGIRYRWGEQSNEDAAPTAQETHITNGSGTFHFPFPEDSQDYFCCDGLIVRTRAWS